MKEIQMFDTHNLVELTLKEAEIMASLNLKTLRIVEQDGEELIVTQDHRVNRINICVINNYVTAIKSIG